MRENPDGPAAQGVSVRLDDLSRERLLGGGLTDLVREQRVVGITSNPTIFAAVIRAGARYDAQIADLARRGVHVQEAAGRTHRCLMPPSARRRPPRNGPADTATVDRPGGHQ